MGRSKPGSRFTESGNTCGSSSRGSKTRGWIGWHRSWVGKYVLTAEDIRACRHFDDAIAVASYPVDLHHPKGGDCTLEYCGDCYDIPYRVLVPEKVENLLVAGRCASFTHEAMASTRVMSTCMALGEAAGRAARIALRDGVKPSQADVAKLRSELKRTGAYLR